MRANLWNQKATTCKPLAERRLNKTGQNNNNNNNNNNNDNNHSNTGDVSRRYHCDVFGFFPD